MDSEDRQAYARRVIANALYHYFDEPHPDVKQEWIERTIAEPHHQGYDGRDLYYWWIDEMRHWLRVVVENDRLVTAYFDGRLDKVFGRLS